MVVDIAGVVAAIVIVLVMIEPLLVMVLGFYCFAGHNVLSRMRLEILRREANTRWVAELFAAKPVSASITKES